jgi:hypothetical protein
MMDDGSHRQRLAVVDKKERNTTLFYVRLCSNFDPFQDYMHAHGLYLKPAAVVKEIPFLPYSLSSRLGHAPHRSFPRGLRRSGSLGNIAHLSKVYAKSVIQFS